VQIYVRTGSVFIIRILVSPGISFLISNTPVQRVAYQAPAAIK